jgi:hypothetical protein
VGEIMVGSLAVAALLGFSGDTPLRALGIPPPPISPAASLMMQF